MTRLTPNRKAVIFELLVGEDRDVVELIETIAQTLHLAVGERQRHEYVKLMHVRHIKQRETASA